MKRNLVFVLSIIILACACEKDKVGNLGFRGIVIDARNNMPVPDSRIDIYASSDVKTFHDSTQFI